MRFGAAVRKILAISFLTLALMCAAQADPLAFAPLDPAPMTKNGSAYFSMGGDVLVQQLPSFNVPYRVNGRSLFTTDASITAGGGALTIGSRVDGINIGNNARIEFSFGGYSGGTTIIGGQGFNVATTVLTISGAPGSFCGGCDGTTSLDVTYREIGGVLRFKTDFMLAPQWTVTPSAGLLASQSALRYKSNTPFFYGAPGFLPPANISEDLNTFRVGTELGLVLGYQATRELSFNAGATLSLYAMNTSLRGNDCFNANQPANLPCTGTLFATNVSSTDSRFGMRDRLSIASTYDAGIARFSVSGFSTWDNAMPGVLNPLAAGTAAQIKYDAKWGYGGAGSVVIPFNPRR